LRAAKSALNQVGLRVIAYSIKTCGPDADDLLVTDALTRFLAYARPDAGSTGAPAAEPVLATASAERETALVLLEELEATISEIESLVTADLVCDDILPVVVHAKSLLDRVGLQVVAHAMRTCLAPRPGASREEIVDDAMVVFLRNVDCVR